MKNLIVFYYIKKILMILQKRLDIMTETNDGFLIAEEDLKIRGPGEILGKDNQDYHLLM